MSKRIVLLSAVLGLIGAGFMLVGYHKAEAKVCFVTDGDCANNIEGSVPNEEACNNLGYLCNSGSTCMDTRDSEHGTSWLSSVYGIGDSENDDALWRSIQCPLNHSYFMDCPRSFRSSCPSSIYEVSQES